MEIERSINTWIQNNREGVSVVMEITQSSIQGILEKLDNSRNLGIGVIQLTFSMRDQKNPDGPDIEVVADDIWIPLEDYNRIKKR